MTNGWVYLASGEARSVEELKRAHQHPKAERGDAQRAGVRGRLQPRAAARAEGRRKGPLEGRRGRRGGRGLGRRGKGRCGCRPRPRCRRGVRLRLRRGCGGSLATGGRTRSRGAGAGFTQLLAQLPDLRCQLPARGHFADKQRRRRSGGFDLLLSAADTTSSRRCSRICAFGCGNLLGLRSQIVGGPGPERKRVLSRGRKGLRRHGRRGVGAAEEWSEEARDACHELAVVLEQARELGPDAGSLRAREIHGKTHVCAPVPVPVPLPVSAACAARAEHGRDGRAHPSEEARAVAAGGSGSGSGSRSTRLLRLRLRLPGAARRRFTESLVQRVRRIAAVPVTTAAERSKGVLRMRVRGSGRVCFAQGNRRRKVVSRRVMREEARGGKSERGGGAGRHRAEGAAPPHAAAEGLAERVRGDKRQVLRAAPRTVKGLALEPRHRREQKALLPGGVQLRRVRGRGGGGRCGSEGVEHIAWSRSGAGAGAGSGGCGCGGSERQEACAQRFIAVCGSEPGAEPQKLTFFALNTRASQVLSFPSDCFRLNDQIHVHKPTHCSL